MNSIASYSSYTSQQLPQREIAPFAFSLCTREEKVFIRACDLLLGDHEEKALKLFYRAARIDPEFLDPWFMAGFIELCNGKVEQARQAFLHILDRERVFEGLYILRFLPNLRVFANLFENFMFRIMPTTPEVAALTARIYMLEDRLREAKKIIHAAYRSFNDNEAVEAVWAQVMLKDGAPEEVIKEFHEGANIHKISTELGNVVTYLCGKAHFELGDFRAGISHWESILASSSHRNPRLTDWFKVATARAYEKEGYLLDTLEILQTVSEPSIEYEHETDVSVSMKIFELTERLKAYYEQGIVKPLRFTEEHTYPRERSTPDFLEFRKTRDSRQSHEASEP